jgi:hypothetical protein
MAAPPQVSSGHHPSPVVDHRCGPPRLFEKMRVRRL